MMFKENQDLVAKENFRMMLNAGGKVNTSKRWISLVLLWVASVPGSLLALYRSWSINPVILGDEYIYAMNAKYFQFWQPPVLGEFSNPLFNFLFSATRFCGSDFYQCGKVLNFLLFTLFATVLGSILLSLTQKLWLAAGFSVLVTLSPTSVYVSMFLPEVFFFLMISLALASALRASKSFTPMNWSVVGSLIGIASLVKPHAWMAFVAVSIFALVRGLSATAVGKMKVLYSGVAFSISTLLTRVIVGFALEGPSGLNFFGQYVTPATLAEVGSGLQQEDPNISPVGGGELEAVFALFPDQLWIHWVSAVALVGFSIYLVLLRVISRSSSAESEVRDFGLLVLIWFLVLLVMIVAFTGWVTGGGDDHTLRVLLRYYDYTYLFLVLASLAIASNGFPKSPLVLRWGILALVVAASSVAYSGMYGRLSIQIADAPYLAGMIVNVPIFNLASIVTVAALFVFAAFPRFAMPLTISVISLTLIPFGFQALAQYDFARGSDRPQDAAGRALAEALEVNPASQVFIAAQTRFEATGIALLGDDPEAQILYVSPGAVLRASDASGADILVLLNGVTIDGGAEIISEGEGFQIVRLED